MTETTLLYILSTLAQTCAALAAFVGAVGLYRLQSLRDEHARNETTLRGLHAAATLNPAAASQQTIDDIVRYTRSNVTERSSTPAAVVENMRRALAEWDAFPKRHRAATTALLVFEAWNLLLIAVSLVGFNYVKFWASSSWTFWGVWGAAIGTVVVTGYSVYAWTIGEDDVRYTHEPLGSGKHLVTVTAAPGVMETEGSIEQRIHIFANKFAAQTCSSTF